MPAWIAGIQVRKDASGDIQVDLDSSLPCWNDGIEDRCFTLSETPLATFSKELRDSTLGWRPPATEGLYKMDAGGHLQVHGLRQRQLIGEKRPLGVDDDEVIDQAKLELRVGQAEIILGCADRLAEVPDLVGKGVQVGQRISRAIACWIASASPGCHRHGRWPQRDSVLGDDASPAPVGKL